MFPLSLYQQETMKNYHNFSVNDLNDQFIGINIFKKLRIKIQQMNIDIFSSQILFELKDYLL